MRSECQNCGAIVNDEDLKPIKDLMQRVEPGEPMPSGECPECGALCQPILGKLAFSRFVKGLKA